MDRVDRVLDRLYIGGAKDFEAPLASLGFAGVLDLRDGVAEKDRQYDGVPAHVLDNRDGDPWTDAQIVAALTFVADHICRGRVLIACHAGMSRSASIAIGYMVRHGWSPIEAHERVRSVRPIIAPRSSMLDPVLALAIHTPSKDQ